MLEVFDAIGHALPTMGADRFIVQTKTSDLEIDAAPEGMRLLRVGCAEPMESGSSLECLSFI